MFSIDKRLGGALLDRSLPIISGVLRRFLLRGEIWENASNEFDSITLAAAGPRRCLEFSMPLFFCS